MENKKPSERIIDIVKPHLIAAGFEFKKSKNDFIKSFLFGRQRFSLRFDGRGGLTTVNCGFFIYFDELIKIYGKILDIKPGDWSFQIGANSLTGSNTSFNQNEGFLFDNKFGNMPLKEKANYTSYQVHPENKVKEGADFIIKAFDLNAQPHFLKINNYEILFDTLIHAVKIHTKTIAKGTPFLNVDLRFDEVNLVYIALILALQLGKDTVEIEELVTDILERYTVGTDEINRNIEKIYNYNKIKSLKHLLE